MADAHENPRIGLLLQLIDQGYDHESWHGPNLLGSIRRVRTEEASWRCGERMRNTWEIVAHCAYWKYVVLRRLTNAPKGGFPRKGSDWIERPGGRNPESWEEDVALLDRIHRELRAAIAALSDTDLEFAPERSSVSNGKLISGVAHHDVYHAGQIQTIRQAFRNRTHR
jgi:uncharacterized damage-inducible protein DinB